MIDNERDSQRKHKRNISISKVYPKSDSWVFKDCEARVFVPQNQSIKL